MGVEARPSLDAQRLRPAGSEVLRLRCANRKLLAATGFRPGVTLDAGLTETVAWFRDPEHLKRYKGHLYNV
jgi:nucleoside-diphosphate-sugar epimerase